LQREKDHLDVLQRERSANSPLPQHRPLPPGAYPNAAAHANHVVVDPSLIPGLGGGPGERRHFPGAHASPDDGGVRAYPSWDDAVGGYTIPAGGVAKMRALSEEDHADAAEYARLVHGAETLAPSHAVAAAAAADHARPAAPSPGAFPGHLPENPDYFNDRRAHTRRVNGPVSFSVAGVDPVEFSRDPRAAAEARIKQEKRDALRAELDEQVRLKKERVRLMKEVDDAREKAEIGRVSHYDRWGKRGGGGEPLVDDAGVLIAELKGVDIRSPANAAAARSHGGFEASLSPGRIAEAVGYPGGDDRAPMLGVPRRGVNPGAGEYSSPFRRAGGGPSSFYLGGEVATGAPGAQVKVTGARHTEAELSMAEVKRLQLIKDLDEQVRIKKEQERIRALEDAIEEAKIERRIQETIEEERRVLALKEAQMAAMNDDNFDDYASEVTGDVVLMKPSGPSGGGRVMNSPPAPPRPLTGTEPEPGMPREDFEGGRFDRVLDDGLEDFEPPPPPPMPIEPEASSPLVSAPPEEMNEETHAIPQSASPPRPQGGHPKVVHSPPASVDHKRQLNFGDVPGLEGHVPGAAGRAPRVVHSPPPSPPLGPGAAADIDRDRDLGSLRSSRQFDRDRNFELDRYHRPRSAHTPQLRDMVAELEADKARLQDELDGKRRALHEAQWEAAHAARERDLAERERDLEAQLRNVRAQLDRVNPGSRPGSRPASAAPSLRASPMKPAMRLSAEGIREPVRVSMENIHGVQRYGGDHPGHHVGQSIADLDLLEEFVVDSKFVRADAPLGVVPGGGNVVAKGNTVRPSELARARKKGASVVQIASPPMRALGPNYTVPDKAPRVAGLQRRPVRDVRPKRDENEPVDRPVWGANRPKSRAIRWT
jgi:hypothetical protein